MRLGNFSLLIPEGYEGGSGHVRLRHGQTYTLRLGNHGSLRCDAEVTVDGKPTGTFRINGNNTITLERPENDTGRFTFLLRNSAEGQAANLSGVPEGDLGLVQVRFKPERYYQPPPQNIVRPVSMHEPTVTGGTTPDWGGNAIEKTSGGICRGMSAGGTGLTGQSGQTFYTVANLDYDPTGEVVISLRLVGSEEASVRPLVAAQRSNPVPPPVR
jgi:hypothetical protein